MLSKRQKTLLENHIYKLLQESIFENGYFENAFLEKKGKSAKHNEEPEVDDEKRNSIIKWLDSEQELHSVLAYELWPEKDKDEARSLFSKKYRGEDNTGKSYEFSPEEINTLYNLRNDFIDDAELDA